MLTFGVLADTHLTSCTPDFLAAVKSAFADCDAIIHAGDLIDISILQAFGAKTVYAVHGNSCSVATQRSLPESITITEQGQTICVFHGHDGSRFNNEDRLLARFPEADCIIYGHTHQPLCQRYGHVLLFNPGSFQGSGRHGAPATYGLLHLHSAGCHGTIHQIQIA